MPRPSAAGEGALRVPPKPKPKPMKNETETQYIEATPTWAEILPLLLAGAENGSAEARAELLRMARIADAYIAAKKGGVL